ncbi:MAG TPA: GntP family permease [Lamprocystis sp. (in: g-proteobacteria)]|nr:GntP family permease [Lamprocystis sp. (in: g-proteobacteria)]
MAELVGIIGIILSLSLLMFLAYRGINVLILAPLLALLAVLMGGQGPLLATYTQVFMQSLGGYLIKYFPLFLLGAIFGKLMDDSGSARAIAHWIALKIGRARSILAIVLACGVLTYGGVSLFVVAFAVYPIAAALFREEGIPKRLVPGTIALGAFTFTMTALPGTPSIQNAIPMPFFHTDAFAAPGLGVIAALIMLVGGVLWLNLRARRAMASGEGYGEHLEPEPEAVSSANLPGIWYALLPIILVIVFNYIFSKLLIPTWDTSYLADAKYGATPLQSVLGIWAIIGAMMIAILALIGLHWSRWKDLKDTVNKGTMGSLLPIFNTASEVGYGTVIASLAAFTLIRNAVIDISPNNPLISSAVAVSVLAGITGSASGGMSIALTTLGSTYLDMATAAGISPEVLHRVVSVASGGFDALPHNGAVITLLAICGLTHRQSYVDIFMVAVVVPVAALVTIVALGTSFGSF